MTEDEVVGWHHQLYGHGFGWTSGVGDGQGGLVCCGLWGHKELDTIERLNWTELMKINYFHILSIKHKNKGNEKKCSNYHTNALISLASKVMLKILQARLQQYMIHELPDVQGGFWKGRGTRDQIANIGRIIEKAREFQKTSISALLIMPKLCVSH